ncbi:MAG: SIMPL domain-containing protein [Myxococcota bacterium]
MHTLPALLLALAIAFGTSAAGWFIGKGFTDARALERTVSVKGLSERDVPADVAIWPLELSVADNDLSTLVANVARQRGMVVEFLKARGFEPAEINVGAPAITDKQAQSYGNDQARFRYLGQQVITVYSKKIDAVRSATSELLELGEAGVVFSQENYALRTQYLFQGLNAIKPEMIEEATRNARAVAERFAADSESRLGKIRTASQGQFTIEDRDSNNPHVKRVRVVSTLEYYLAD